MLKLQKSPLSRFIFFSFHRIPRHQHARGLCLRVSILTPEAPNRSPFPTKPEHFGGRTRREATDRSQLTSPSSSTMLRVAGRRLSSALAWRPAAAASGSRGPLAGTLPGRDDDDTRDCRARFAIESPFFAAARGICRGRSSHPRSDLLSR